MIVKGSLPDFLPHVFADCAFQLTNQGRYRRGAHCAPASCVFLDPQQKMHMVGHNHITIHGNRRIVLRDLFNSTTNNLSLRGQGIIILRERNALPYGVRGDLFPKQALPVFCANGKEIGTVLRIIKRRKSICLPCRKHPFHTVSNLYSAQRWKCSPARSTVLGKSGRFGLSGKLSGSSATAEKGLKGAGRNSPV